MRNLLILFTLICLLTALPCLAKDKKERQATDKSEFIQSIETIAKGSTMEAHETNLVHVTIAPFKLIFTISF